MEAVITRQTSPEEAYRKLDEMASKQTEQLRKLTKQVQEARQNHDDEAVKKTVNEYDEALERYGLPLTDCGLMTPYGDKDLSQLWFW